MNWGARELGVACDTIRDCRTRLAVASQLAVQAAPSRHPRPAGDVTAGLKTLSDNRRGEPYPFASLDVTLE